MTWGFLAAIATARLSRPCREYVYASQGFMEMQGLRPFRGVTPEEYLGKTRRLTLKPFTCACWKCLERRRGETGTWYFLRDRRTRLCRRSLRQGFFPMRSLRFTRGTIFQKTTERAGLKVIRFGNPPEEICELIASATAVFCVDSFPSHLAQMWKDRAVVMLTEMKAEMTVHPGGFPRSGWLRRARNVIPAGTRPALTRITAARRAESSARPGNLPHTWRNSQGRHWD